MALLIFFLMITCKKNNDTSAPVEKELKTSDLQNLNNPNDQVGQIHNEFLDYFIQHADLTLKKVTRGKLLQITQAFYISKNLPFGSTESSQFTLMLDAIASAEKSNCDWISDPCTCIPNLCSLTIDFPTLPSDLLSETQAGTSSDRTLNFIKSVKVTEQKIIDDKVMSADKKAILLNYFSIARYSIGYWNNVYNVYKTNNLFYPYLQLKSAALEEGDIWEIVLADLRGARYGFWLGGAGGAAAGAAICSAIKALEYSGAFDLSVA